MTTQTCSHHWHVEPPDGPESAAVCQICGAKTMMPNHFEEDRKYRSYPIEPGGDEVQKYLRDKYNILTERR